MGSPSRSTVPDRSSKSSNIAPVPKRLHYIIIGSAIPSFALGLPLSIFCPSAWGILGLIFSLFSSASSLYRVRKGETYEYQIRLPGNENFEQQRKGKNAGSFALFDFVLAGGMFSWVVLSFIMMSNNRHDAVHFLLAYVSMVWIGQWYVSLLSILNLDIVTDG
jgi:hypothetical protein